MNKQQIIQKLSYIATNFDDANVIRANIFRFISEITQEGVTENQTHNARSFPVDVRQEIVLRDHFTCAYCNRVGTIDCDSDGELWTIDHVIPWSKGGLTCIDNGVLACHRCNSEKRDMTPAEYMRWIRLSLSNTPNDDMREGCRTIVVEQSGISDDGDGLGLSESLIDLYGNGGWHSFFESYFELNPDVTQSTVRRAMSLLDGRHPDTFKTEAFRYYHRFSPNGDPQKAERT